MDRKFLDILNLLASDFHNFRWQKLPKNDTAFLVIKQERKHSTKYVISYNDIKVSLEKAMRMVEEEKLPQHP